VAPDNYRPPERRRCYRVTSPDAARCRLRIGERSFEVVDISRRGIRFLNPDKIKLSEWIGASITLHDGSSLAIEGKVIWTDDHLLGMQLLDPIPPYMILSEQCYLIQEQVSAAGSGTSELQAHPKRDRRLYLVRHGEPVPETVNRERPLSDKGRRDVKQVGAFLAGAGLSLGVILHSEKIRAAQTARLLGEVIPAKQGIIGRSGLAPEDSVEPMLMEAMAAVHDTMIVGHLPFLDRLVRVLLGAEADQPLLSFEPGCVVCLIQRDRQLWEVEWMIIPDLIPGD